MELLGLEGPLSPKPPPPPAPTPAPARSAPAPLGPPPTRAQEVLRVAPPHSRPHQAEPLWSKPPPGSSRGNVVAQVASLAAPSASSSAALAAAPRGATAGATGGSSGLKAAGASKKRIRPCLVTSTPPVSTAAAPPQVAGAPQTATASLIVPSVAPEQGVHAAVGRAGESAPGASVAREAARREKKRIRPTFVAPLRSAKPRDRKGP